MACLIFTLTLKVSFLHLIMFHALFGDARPLPPSPSSTFLCVHNSRLITNKACLEILVAPGCETQPAWNWVYAFVWHRSRHCACLCLSNRLYNCECCLRGLRSSYKRVKESSHTAWIRTECIITQKFIVGPK